MRTKIKTLKTKMKMRDLGRDRVSVLGRMICYLRMEVSIRLSNNKMMRCYMTKR